MVIWSTRSNKKNALKRPQNKAVAKPKASPYHCVEIKTSYDACEAVLKLHGERFLSAEAPMLPVADVISPVNVPSSTIKIVVEMNGEMLLILVAYISAEKKIVV